MNKRNTKYLIKENIFLLIPLILYAIYKNGYLIYQKELISIYMIFKPLYLVLISVGIKTIIDLIKHKKILFNYDYLYVILIAMIMPYNINLILYTISFLILYFLSTIFDKYINVNKVTYIYLIIILINGLLNEYTFLNPLEANYTYNFSFLDLISGRLVSSISTSSIIIILIILAYLFTNFYYKKTISISIISTYLIFMFIYYIVTNNYTYILNPDLLFGSVFVATLPMYSPSRVKHQYIYGILIGILSTLLALFIDMNISIYISILFISIIMGIYKLMKKEGKK